jgi:Uma2 family endonuclease
VRKLKQLFTAEELERLPAVGRRLELVKGKVYEMAPAGGRHGYVAMNSGMALGSHVSANDLGRVFAAETGFILRRNPDTVRAPDCAFISNRRLPSDEIPDSFIEMAPDLVIEVVSPSDSPREVREKAEEWLRAGVRLVWLLYPATRTAMVYRSLDDPTNLTEHDHLDGNDVVPGFTCPVGDLFD